MTGRHEALDSRAMNALHRTFLSVVVLSVVSACGSVSSEDDARRAYLGLDNSIEKALALGFQGFNEASSANISPQTTEGDEAGLITISGQVDQGASANKGMRLFVLLEDYTDGPVVVTEDGDELEIAIVYNTDPDAQPALNLNLRDIPDGTFTGTLAGDFQMAGELKGSVHLELTFSGELESDGQGGTRRSPGTTLVTGTATADNDSTFEINVTI